MTDQLFHFEGQATRLARMEFGKLTDLSKLADIDWRLPPDPPLNAQVLKPGVRTKFFMGAPAWGHKEWIGKVYPPKTKSTEFLHHYARAFNTIELNTSHYRIPSSEQTQKWREQVPSHFVFCGKLHQDISHARGGLLDKRRHAEWFRFLEDLGENRGPCFLQLPPSFTYAEKAELFQFLQNWPSEFALALEFRHPTWWTPEGQLLPALQQYLQRKKIGLVITDVAGRRDVLHTALSAGFTMLRFIGNGLHPTDFERARHWYQKLKLWKEQGLQDAFIFVHEPDDIAMPEMADHFIRHFNETLGEQVLPPLPAIAPAPEAQAKMFD